MEIDGAVIDQHVQGNEVNEIFQTDPGTENYMLKHEASLLSFVR